MWIPHGKTVTDTFSLHRWLNKPFHLSYGNLISLIQIKSITICPSSPSHPLESNYLTLTASSAICFDLSSNCLISCKYILLMLTMVIGAVQVRQAQDICTSAQLDLTQSADKKSFIWIKMYEVWCVILVNAKTDAKTATRKRH